jgi:hypothetical protein
MDQNIQKKIRAWQRDLINLSRRNKLLNFKTSTTAATIDGAGTKVKRRGTATNIEIIDEFPREVFRILQLDGKSMTFLPLDEGQKKIVDATSNPQYSATALPARYTDTKLQTSLPEDKLGATLLRVYQRANTLLVSFPPFNGQ